MPHDAFLSRFLALAAVVFALNGPVNAEECADAALSGGSAITEPEDSAGEPDLDAYGGAGPSTPIRTAGKRND